MMEIKASTGAHLPSAAAPSQPSERLKGLLLCLTAVLFCFSPDALLVRLLGLAPNPAVYSTSASSVLILAWKCLLTGCFNMLAALWLEGGRAAKLVSGLLSGPGHVALASLIQCLALIGFTLSFLLTDPATALLLISLNPLHAAVLGWLVMGEALPLRTRIALGCASLSLGFVFLPDIVAATTTFGAATSAAEAASTDPPASEFAAHLIALATGLCVALYLVVVRHAAIHCPRASMNAASGLGALLAAALAVSMASVQHVPLLGGHDTFETPAANAEPALKATFYGLAALDALALASAMVLQNLALRSISGTEVALVLLLQVALGPLYVYLGLGEAPTPWTMVGGSILLIVLVAHELASLRQSAAPRSSREHD